MAILHCPDMVTAREIDGMLPRWNKDSPQDMVAEDHQGMKCDRRFLQIMECPLATKCTLSPFIAAACVSYAEDIVAARRQCLSYCLMHLVNPDMHGLDIAEARKCLRGKLLQWGFGHLLVAFW